MPKHYLTATTSYGTFKRQTFRPYTHVVIERVREPNGSLIWRSAAWSMSEKGAQSAARRIGQYRETRVIPVDLQGGPDDARHA